MAQGNAVVAANGSDCCICMCEHVDPVSCHWCCGMFCRSCLADWLCAQEAPSCPLCRHEMNYFEYGTSTLNRVELSENHEVLLAAEFQFTIDEGELQTSIIRVNLEYLNRRHVELATQLAFSNVSYPVAVQVLASLRAFLEDNARHIPESTSDRDPITAADRRNSAATIPIFAMKYGTLLDIIEDEISRRSADAWELLEQQRRTR
jgi:hypothetical protein